MRDDPGYMKATRDRQKLAKGCLNPDISVDMVPIEEKQSLISIHTVYFAHCRGL